MIVHSSRRNNDKCKSFKHIEILKILKRNNHKTPLLIDDIANKNNKFN